MGNKEPGYRGKSTIDYLPLKNHIVLEGLRNSPSGIILPDTVNVDTEKFEKMVVVAIGPRAMEEGLEIGDAVALDPRMAGYGITLPKELSGDRVFIEYEMTVLRGIIPKRALKRMSNENKQFVQQFTTPEAPGKPN